MLLSKIQTNLRNSARKFAQREIAPQAQNWERRGTRVPESILRRMGALGFFGMLIPERWGGSGLDFVSYALVTEEFAAADCGICNLMNVSNSPVAAAIRDHGTDEQRERILQPLAAGAIRGCFALTEAESGSDASTLTTLAERRGSGYVLRGAKHFVTGGKTAHIAMLIARTNPSLGTHGITAFLVRTNSPGYSVARLERKLGHLNCDTAHVRLENVEVSRQDMLGPEGEGYKIALSYLNGGRIGVAAQSVGVARAALEAAVSYAKNYSSFGRPLIENQAVAFELADMATDVAAARNITLHAASVEDAGGPAVTEASMAKLFASQTAERVASKAVQIHGNYGCLRDHSVEKYYRDARVLSIYEGTNDIQRIIIGRQLLDKME